MAAVVIPPGEPTGALPGVGSPLEVPQVWAVRVFCTDRGQHPRRRIAFSLEGDDGPVGGPMAHRGQRVDWVYRGRRRYVLACQTCGRAPQLREETWRALVDGLWSAGVSEVDISRLPF